MVIIINKHELKYCFNCEWEVLKAQLERLLRQLIADDLIELADKDGEDTYQLTSKGKYYKETGIDPYTNKLKENDKWQYKENDEWQ